MSQKIFFTPGPTQLYFTVSDHLKSAIADDVMSISHRSHAFEQIMSNTRENLKSLLDLPNGYEVYFTSSANEIWERIIQNLVKSHSHHFVNGAFSKKFYDFSQDYQKASTCMQVGDGLEFSDWTIPSETELISVTLNETSIGYGFDVANLKALRAAHPDKLIALDGVSAFPAVGFDFSLIDTAYFSVQKSFGLPSGLGVWIVNEKCYQKQLELKKQGIVTGSYHSLDTLKANGVKNQTPETPNTLGIYLLGKVAEDMLYRTRQQIQNDTIYKATVLYQALTQSKTLHPFIGQKANQSKTVIVARCDNGNQAILKDFEKQGWILGDGYGKYKNDHIRIANFPMHSKEMMEQMADQIIQY